MQLLVSVTGPVEARAALQGGADVIDAKDPRRGALGPVPLPRLEAIRAAVAGAQPLSAALGDAASETVLAQTVAAAAAVGLAFVKVGFAGVTSAARARRLAVAAQRKAAGVGGTRLVLVAYADWSHVESLAPAQVVALAAGQELPHLAVGVAGADRIYPLRAKLDRQRPGERLDGCEGCRDHGTVGWWPDDRSAGHKGDGPAGPDARRRETGAGPATEELAVHVRARAGQVLLQERARTSGRGGHEQVIELAHVAE